MTTAELVRRTYETRAVSFKDRGYRSTWWYLANKALSDWALLEEAGPDGAAILNVGCSEPIDELYFARRAGSWTAIDFSPASIRAAREIFRREASSELLLRIHFQVTDARALPFADATFDIVTAFSTIDHIPDAHGRDRTLREIHRVLKPGGRAVVTVPNRWCIPYARWSRKAQRAGTTDFGYEYQYSPPELSRALRAAGFRLVSFRSNYGWVVDGKLWPFALLPYLSRYFGSRMGYLARKP